MSYPDDFDSLDEAEEESEISVSGYGKCKNKTRLSLSKQDDDDRDYTTKNEKSVGPFSKKSENGIELGNICEHCGIVTITSISLKKHMKAHADGYFCKYCPQVFLTSYGRNYHQNLHGCGRHREVEDCSQCLLCGGSFAFVVYLEFHLLELHGIDFVKESSMRLGLAANPDDVVTEKFDIPMYRCGECYQVFNYSFNLDCHMALHSKSSYGCAVCDSTFGVLEDIVTHVSEHNPARIKQFTNCIEENGYIKIPVCNLSNGILPENRINSSFSGQTVRPLFTLNNKCLSADQIKSNFDFSKNNSFVPGLKAHENDPNGFEQPAKFLKMSAQSSSASAQTLNISNILTNLKGCDMLNLDNNLNASVNYILLPVMNSNNNSQVKKINTMTDGVPSTKTSSPTNKTEL